MHTDLPNTPGERLHVPRPRLPSVGGPRRMDLPLSTRSTVYDAVYNNYRTSNAPVPYSSTEQFPNSGRPPMQRRQSTKQLIHRFESMTDAASIMQFKGPPSSARAASEIDSREMHRPFLTTAPHKNKRRSFSNSLRNFMSVFKKKKDKETDDGDYFPPYHDPEPDEVFPPGLGELVPHLPTPQIVSRPSVKDIALARSNASSLLTGSLLYLSRSSSSQHRLPVWLSCTVALHESHLLVTWFTMHENPSSHVISLNGFTDVRSLSSKYMDPDERALLPSAEEEPRTFELLFGGSSKETFAAASSHDRARWIGAIWDAVLGSQDTNSTSPYSQKHVETPAVRTDVSSKPHEPDQYLQVPSPSEETSSQYTSSVVPQTTTTESAQDSSPPTTPVGKSPLPQSPLSLFPPRPPSQLSVTSSHSRSKSPSIAKLGTLSVVTQRLAEIERSEPATPAPTTVSSSSVGTALRRAQTTRSTGTGRAFAAIERLQEEGETSSTFVATPSTDASIVIPLPQPPNTPTSGVGSSRIQSPFKRRHMERDLPPVPTPPSPSSPLKAPTSIPAPAPTLRAELSEPAIRKHVENPASLPLVVGVEPHLAPLAELIKDSAAKHYDQTAGLGEQIISLQRDIHDLPNEMQLLLGRAVAAGTKRVPEAKPQVDNANLKAILARLEEIKKQISASSEGLQIDSVVKMFEGLQGQLAMQVPLLMEKLASIEQGQTQLRFQTMQDVGKPSSALPTPTRSLDVPTPSSFHLASQMETSPQDGPPHPSVDLSDIYSKLDELATLYKSSGAPSNEKSDASPEGTSHADLEKLHEILDHLRTGEEQRKLQLDQQADSVRYLNELNSWLDAFVNGGTIHIQSVAANIEQLCAHLGVPSEEETANGEAPKQGMLGEIRQLISSIQAKGQSEEQLQASVGALVGAVQDHMKNDGEQRKSLVTDSVLEIIHRQRYEQEQMLRALSTELTNEIRGERLRFVEAMKEATAINVQAHVEHFKAELSREVAAMTQDVGKLHQEKQVIEQQIADLFAFYSKQKQEADNNARRNPPSKAAGFSNLQNVPAAKRPRRPLPHPVFQRGE